MDSYETIVSRMKKSFWEKSGYKVDEASDIAIRIRILAGEIFSLNTYLEWVKNQIFPQTAQGKQLDYHAQLRGLERKKSAKAASVLYFTLSEAATSVIIIPKGTICSTEGDDPIRYITKTDNQFNVGSSALFASVEAMEPGAKGNAAKNTVTKIVSLPISNMSVTNPYVFTGGVDEESDENLRERILESYRDISNGTNCAFYKSVAKSVTGVHSAGIIPRNRGAGTLDIYIANKGATASSSAVYTVQEKLNAMREVNVDVKVMAAATELYNIDADVVLLPGYDIDSVKAAFEEAAKNYFENLEVGQSVYLSVLGDLIYHIPGVKNYRFNSYIMGDYEPPQSKLMVLGSVTVNEEE